ncbi:hypothetical protein ACFL38_02245 [Candidatus Omnitrophota bacterium]
MINSIILIAFGAYLIYFGIKTKKNHPEKTIQLFKPVNAGNVIAIGGSIMAICGLGLIFLK